MTRRLIGLQSLPKMPETAATTTVMTNKPQQEDSNYDCHMDCNKKH